MHIIAHRRNTISELQLLPTKYGVEIDIRSSGDELIVEHDPYSKGESLIDWLRYYSHGCLIVNLKEEGLESKLMDLLTVNGVDNYFFLDQSFPFLIKWAKLGHRKSAVRISEFESMQTAVNLSGLVDWIWIDSFTKFPLNYFEVERLKILGFKLCIVSPELHGRSSQAEIINFKKSIQEMIHNIDAVCTKRMDLWEMK